MSSTPSIFRTQVVRTERLTPRLVRVVVGGDDVAGFPDNGFTDRYAKLVFPRPGTAFDPSADMRALPSADRPVLRTYTIRRIDTQARELTIDFVTHGEDGIAGPWAASAAPGDELLLTPPGGAYAPGDDADLHLLVGDDAALPAIASALEVLPAGSRALVLVEVDDAESELPLPSPGDIDLRWLHRANGAGPDALLEAVRALELPSGRIQAFVHGELLATRAIKRHLLDDRGLDAALLSASGYWRRGKDEDGFQAEKRELAATDAAT